jgi:glycosyltransferase involved in cell wall biosynthesis
VKPRLIVIGPLPPPHHGVSVSTELVLENSALRERFEVQHLDTSDHRTIGNVGRWDIRNIVEALSALPRLARKLNGEPGLVYLPISQGIPGLARDTLFIRIAKARRWKVATHLRGSELGGVIRRQPRLVKAWLRSSLKQVDSFAVLGDSLRDVLEGVIPPDEIAVVPNGTPEPQVVNGGRSDFGLYLGNMYPRKGALEAMEAALMVSRERPQARFVFAGECPDEGFLGRLERIASQTDGRITLRPPVVGAEKDELLSSAGFLLFPPRRQEGHPRVVLEAMAHGLPIITTDRGAIAETVVDDESGYVLPVPAPTDLRDRILRLYDDANLREGMGRAARARYEERFTQTGTDRELAQWLTQIAADNQR